MLYSIAGVRRRSECPIARTSSGVMWRRSARGCTVIPGAPAAMQTSTASRTFGSRPPRELRSVATLFTLTESFVLSLSKMFPYDIDDLLGPAADLVLLLSLEHHAQQRLGSGVADQQAALAGDA